MWRGTRIQVRLPVTLVVLLAIQLLASGRILQQSGGDTADQLVSDGSDTSVPQAVGGSSVAAASSTAASPSTNVAEPPAQQIRLRWANQVDALPPTYQGAGASVLNDILGPSGEQNSTDGQDASPDLQPWYSTPGSAAAPAAANAAVTEAVVPVTIASPSPSPTPTPLPATSSTPLPTLAPVETPAAVEVRVATPAAVVQAPALAPEADQLLVPLLGGAMPVPAPDAAPAPVPAPALNIACSDSGTNNDMGLSICRFMTGILPQSTRTRMCSRYLPKCAPAATPVEAPATSAITTAATAPTPAQPEASAPAVGSTPQSAGSLLQPLLAGLASTFGGGPSSNGSSGGSGLAGLLG